MWGRGGKRALEKMDYGYWRDLRRVATCHNEANQRGPYVKKRVKNRINADVLRSNRPSEFLMSIRKSHNVRSLLLSNESTMPNAARWMVPSR